MEENHLFHTEFATEDEKEVPEIARLDDFLKSLEDQLNANDINLFKEVPELVKVSSIDSQDGGGSEEDEEQESGILSSSITTEKLFEEFQNLQTEEDLLSPFNDVSYDSSVERFFENHSEQKDVLKTPPPFSDPTKPPFPFGENTFTVLKTPSSRLDEFLMALHRAGYGNIDIPAFPSTADGDDDNPENRRLSALSERAYNYFFESALGGDDSQGSPNLQRERGKSNNPSPSEQEYIIQKLNSCMIRSEDDFTAESLKRNWDLEEEYEDELTEKLQSISKVIQEKRKTSMENLFSATDEDITHYSSLQSKNSHDKGHSDDEEEEEEEEEDEELKQVALMAEMPSPIAINGEGNHHQRNKPIDEDVSFSSDNSFPSPTSRRTKKSHKKHDGKGKAEVESGNNEDLKDNRLNGDFIIWSSGKMLNGDYTTEIYMGMYENNITHFIDSGKLMPLKRLISPTSSVVTSSDPFSSASQLHDFTGNILSSTSNLLTLSTSSTTVSSGGPNMRGFYPIHVMECVIRPDIELKHFMSVAVKVSKSLQLKCIPLQRSHIVITPGNSYNNTNQTTTAKIASMITSTLSSSQTYDQPAVKEWEQIDVQIVISRELRQRVLLIQFLRRVPQHLFSAAGGNTAASTLNNKNNAISNMLSGTFEYVPLSRCPKTRKFISQLKTEIIHQKISLSALYHAPLKTVCSLSNGLDIHFLAQLHSLCRELMWQKLILEYKEMEDHIDVQKRDANILFKILEPMYKQYNLKVPDVWHKKRHRYFSQYKAHQDKQLQQAKQSRESDDSAPVTSRTAVEQVMIDSSQLTEDPSIGSPQSVAKSTNDRNSFNFHLQNRYIRDLLSSPKVDGMTFCLIMLDKCYYELQQKCDEEYARKIQSRHELTLQYIQDIAEYKKELFYYFLDNKEYKVSKLYQSFKQTFTGVFIDEQLIIPPVQSSSASPSEPTAPSSSSVVAATTASSTSTKKSWFQGLSSSIQQISTNITHTPPTVTTSTITSSSSSSSFTPAVITIDESHVILYYCGCLINTIPGYLYLTKSYLFLTSSIFGLNSRKEIYSLSALKEINVVSGSNPAVSSALTSNTTANSTPAASSSSLKDSIQASATNLMNSNAIKLIFTMKSLATSKVNHMNAATQNDMEMKWKEVLLSPLAVDCNKLKTIIAEVQLQLL